jgi:uncharacterized membrane protein YidH (DUF202 family)
MKDLLTVIGYALMLIAAAVLAGAAAAWVTQAMLDAHASMLTAAIVYGAMGFMVTFAFIAPAFLRKPNSKAWPQLHP